MSRDPFVMTSVRDPIQHFMSLYKYSHVHQAVERLIGRQVDQWDGIRIFLSQPNLIQNIYATYKEDEVRDTLQIHMVQPNLQLFSLGLTSFTFSKIKQLVETLDFVVIVERFDESMVILRERLCCAIENVVYRKQNVRRSLPEQHQEIPNDIRKAILKFNSGDYLLYQAANKRLDTDIRAVYNFQQLLGIYRFELVKYEKKCKEEDRNEEIKTKLCPPITNGQIGNFVESIRTEQREKLLAKLQAEYKRLAER